MGQMSFFDISGRLSELEESRDTLERLKNEIEWEEFRVPLESALGRAEHGPGRKPFDAVLMFKVLILQSLYNLSDAEAEYQIKDRLSFMKFLSLSFENRVPDEKTIWLYRETLSKAGTLKALFEEFDGHLSRRGYSPKKGTIIDASIVKVRTQNIPPLEKKSLKEGMIPKAWSKQELSQRDVDASWTKKRGRMYFGYKNHIGIDAAYKLIRSYEVSSAAVPDSHLFENLLDGKNSRKSVWADAAYHTNAVTELLKRKNYRGYIQHQPRKRRTLTEGELSMNSKYAKIRMKVEHVFGFQDNSMRRNFIRSIGLLRARTTIGLRNLTYNLMRYIFLERCSA